MLYFQPLFYTGSLLLLSYHCSQLIPDIYRTELVLGTSSQFVILLVYNFSSCILSILFSDHLQSTHIVPIFLLVSEMCLIGTILFLLLAGYILHMHCIVSRRVVIFPLISICFSIGPPDIVIKKLIIIQHV